MLGKKTVTKLEVIDYIEQNAVKLEEVKYAELTYQKPRMTAGGVKSL